jgi:hypothetical protein
MKQLFVIFALLIIAGCQSATMSPATSPGAASEANGSIKHLIWEPPPVVATNDSDRTASFVVSSQCNPVPYSPSSGTIRAGSLLPINFEPNGNPCSYQSVSIKANDTLGVPQDECDLLVVGDNIDVINYANTDCGLNYLGSGKWGFSYSLVSGAVKRGSHKHLN